MATEGLSPSDGSSPRKPFGQLVEALIGELADEPDIAIVTLAQRYGETVERVVDALDAIQMLAGSPTYVRADGRVR